MATERARINPEETPVISELGSTVVEQVNRLIRFGLHREMYPYVTIPDEDAERRYSEDFILPEGAKRPEGYRRRFDIPVVVDPRVDLRTLLDKARIERQIDISKITNLRGVSGRTCLIWTNNGHTRHYFSVGEATGRFSKDQIGSTLSEVIAIFLQHPEYFEGRGIIAAGSRYEDGNRNILTPFVSNLNDSVNIGAIAEYDPIRPGWGVSSRGKEIIKFKSVSGKATW